jgi:hypothetical protein
MLLLEVLTLVLFANGTPLSSPEPEVSVFADTFIK